MQWGNVAVFFEVNCCCKHRLESLVDRGMVYELDSMIDKEIKYKKLNDTIWRMAIDKNFDLDLLTQDVQSFVLQILK